MEMKKSGTTRWRAWLHRSVPYLGRRMAEKDLDYELRLHLELERERHLDAGLSEKDARRAARRRLGNAALIRERTRDVWGWRWLDDLARDVRHAVRSLRRSPGFAATVVLVLALGIGANTAMFGVVHGMLIRPLPYPDGERLVRVGKENPRMPRGPVYLSAHMLEQMQETAESFEQLAAYGSYTFSWRSPDGARPWGAPVSPALLRLLGATPQLGRLFADDEARRGADGVVLLSHRAWTRRFGTDPDVVGTVVEVGGERRTVVGVLAEGFYFPGAREEVWTPYVMHPDEPTAVVLGRLRPGVSAAQATTEVRAILQRLDDAGPSNGEASGRTSAVAIPIRVRTIPLLEEMVGAYRPALAALASATVLVLLIACVNVAGLLLARGVTRQRGLAVCAALGAGRGRIVRQLLTESMLLSLGGGVLGLAAAAVVLRGVPALVPGNIVRLDEVNVDGVVLAFTLGLSALVGLVFGVAPALQSSGGRLLRTLVEGSARSTGGFGLLRANRTRAVLAASQVALALVLLVGAVLLLRSFVGLVTADRGYDPTNVVTAGASRPYSFDPEGATTEEFIEEEASRRRFYTELDQALDGLARLPDVAAVGVTSRLPLAGSGSVQQRVHVLGRPPPGDPEESPTTLLHVASPGYFETMRLRLLGGRVFTRGDGAGAPRVLVVNETFAREVLRGAPAVGQRVRFARDNGGDDMPWEVIGVVADVTYWGLAVTGQGTEAFAPVGQIEAAPQFALNFPRVAVRTNGDPRAAIPFLREAVSGTRPGAAAEYVMTMDALLSNAVAEPRFYAVLVACFAALAFLLAACGVFGLLSYNVAQRRGEIAIRMALGAQRGDVLALVVRQGAVLVASGTVIGLAGAAASSRILESFLFGVATGDRLTFIAAPLVLIAVALVACWLPARRAARIDPLETLRFE